MLRPSHVDHTQSQLLAPTAQGWPGQGWGPGTHTLVVCRQRALSRGDVPGLLVTRCLSLSKRTWHQPSLGRPWGVLGLEPAVRSPGPRGGHTALRLCRVLGWHASSCLPPKTQPPSPSLRSLPTLGRRPLPGPRVPAWWGRRPFLGFWSEASTAPAVPLLGVTRGHPTARARSLCPITHSLPP